MFLGSTDQMPSDCFCDFCWASMSWKCFLVLGNAGRELVSSVGTKKKGQESPFSQVKSVSGTERFWNLRYLWLLGRDFLNQDSF